MAWPSRNLWKPLQHAQSLKARGTQTILEALVPMVTYLHLAQKRLASAWVLLIAIYWQPFSRLFIRCQINEHVYKGVHGAPLGLMRHFRWQRAQREEALRCFWHSLMRLSRSGSKKPVKRFKYFPQFSFKTGDKRAKTVWQQNYRMQIREQQLGLYETENRQKFS